MIDFDIENLEICMKVVGVGGGGGSVLWRLAEDLIPNVGLIAVDTAEKNLSALEKSGVQTIQIGERLTHGYGTGGKAEVGEKRRNRQKTKFVPRSPARISSLSRPVSAAAQAQERRLSWRAS